MAAEASSVKRRRLLLVAMASVVLASWPMSPLPVSAREGRVAAFDDVERGHVPGGQSAGSDGAGVIMCPSDQACRVGD